MVTSLLTADRVKKLLVLGNLVLGALSVFSVVWAYSGVLPTGEDCVVPGNLGETIDMGINLVVLLPTMLLATWLTAVSTTLHLRKVALYTMLQWVNLLCSFFGQLGWVCMTSFHRPPWADGSDDAPILAKVLEPLGSPTGYAAIIAGYDLAISRVEAVEEASLLSFSSGFLRKFIYASPLLVALEFLAILLGNFGVAAAGDASIFVAMLGGLLYVLAWSALCYLALFPILRRATQALDAAPGMVAAEVKKVPAALRMEIAFLALSFVSTAVSLGASATTHVLKLLSFRDVSRTGFLVDIVCNCFLALALSGALSGALQGTHKRAVLAGQRKKRRRVAVARWKGRKDRNEGWDEKVADLAQRAVSLDALLNFYEKLPTLMPHFDELRHSTRDVVCQSIIPMTKEKCCSGAELLMNGERLLPDKMVTHAWCNRFQDLVAAILADAFGEPEYDLFSMLLSEDFSKVRRWVVRRGVGERTYWICAFAVNQHRGICENNDMIVDPVIGKYCERCDCGLEKAWNDSGPRLADGRSVPCEMNKFEDMMRYLAVNNPNFAQVVPIDADFFAFTRAWCIAELASANDLGMVQDLKIGSSGHLAMQQENLNNLRIQDMEATRPEDKEAILQSIEDVGAFNMALQRLLFEELLPSWSSLDAQERMSCAGRILRWGTIASKLQAGRLASDDSVTL